MEPQVNNWEFCEKPEIVENVNKKAKIRFISIYF